MLSDEIKSNVQSVIDCLKSIDDDAFNIKQLVHESDKHQGSYFCGTPACIAGWSYWLMHNKPELINLSKPILEDAAQYLGVPYTMGKNNIMFDTIFNNCHDFDDASRNDAIIMLEHYRDTGIVVWENIPENKEHSNEYS